jgi:hypothetical protein
MSAREKVAKAINPNHPDIALHIADAAIAAHLEALNADGCVVVHLPDSDVIDRNGYEYWDRYDIHCHPDDGVIYDEGRELTAAEMTGYVGALLAAAAKAEGKR